MCPDQGSNPQPWRIRTVMYGPKLPGSPLLYPSRVWFSLMGRHDKPGGKNCCQLAFKNVVVKCRRESVLWCSDQGSDLWGLCASGP